MLRKLINTVLSDQEAKSRTALANKLIGREAKVGGQLFGQVPKGVRREFFCLDSHTWVWHEEWTDKNGQTQVQTTRYDVRPDRVFKSQNGQYTRVNNRELATLKKAAAEYVSQVKSSLYSQVA